jgi:CheY-like chemotaxis protein
VFPTRSNCFSIEKHDRLTKAGVAKAKSSAFSDCSGCEGRKLPRVLVVDDDPMVCIAIEVCLQRQGFDVTIADGGETGMRELASAAFDVMLVDIFMPHMRGFESIRLFHERAPEIPLIAMSGYAFANADTASPDFLRMTLELGATRCLRKPFTPQALLAAVNDCLAKPTMSAHHSKK